MDLSKETILAPRARLPMYAEDTIYRILPYYYLHVLDQTTNVSRVEVGPQTYVRKDNEQVLLGPEKMVIVPPCHYCAVSNPVVRKEDNSLLYDTHGQVKLRHADIEIRLEQEPFPLYPGEILKEDVTPLTVLLPNSALHLKAIRGFEDEGVKQIAGDEWLFEGPGIYIPRKEVEVLKTVQATVIKPNQALLLRARTETKDRDGNPRVTGEVWLVKKVGAYLPGAYEEIVDVVNAYVLTEKEAVRVQASKTFMDGFKKPRKNGEEWLITLTDTETYIPDVYEKVLGIVKITTITNRQYCVILDPVGPDGKNQYGKKKLVKGEKSFFLLPGESLENDIEDVHILNENEGLVLRAIETFKDDHETPPVTRKAGDFWMVKGPSEYIPPIEVKIVEKRYAIPLDDNEGIYVRNTKTGKVRVVRGSTYMLTQDEELWHKELPSKVVELLGDGHDPYADRGRYRKMMTAQSEGFASCPIVERRTEAVTFRVPHNAAVQIYDYKAKKARVVFGPEFVMLGPDEQFTQLSLSGDKPKRPAVIDSLCLLLGPDFCTDIVNVETADHARLSLQLSYNWHFDIADKSEKAGTAIFNVPDFIGDMCKAVASRIRGAVAGINFDDFHKNSAKIIRSAVFGMDDKQKVKDSLRFSQNNLVITSVDIQNVEPVDERTRESLQKSVQLAIEITTHSQEATAKQQAECREQEAHGCLERQRISDEIEAEKIRKQLLELKVSSKVTEMCGQSKAETLGCIEAQKLKAEATVEEAKKAAEAIKIKAAAEMENLQKTREAELIYMKAQMDMEILKRQKMAEIETEQFEKLITALGSETITAIATAGPELQAKLLQGLGIRSTLITDGNTPMNLFTTAKGLLGGDPF